MQMPEFPGVTLFDKIGTVSFPNGIAGLAGFADHTRGVPESLGCLTVLSHFDDGCGGYVEQQLSNAAVHLEDLFIRPAGDIDAVGLAIILGRLQPGRGVSLNIGIPDRAIAYIHTLILTKGSRSLVFRFLHPDVFHFGLVFAIAMVHNMPAHDILNGLCVQSSLRKKRHGFQIAGICSGSPAGFGSRRSSTGGQPQRGDQKNGAKRPKKIDFCLFHFFPLKYVNDVTTSVVHHKILGGKNREARNTNRKLKL